jgi:uncharacterized protein (DUF2147 family)
MLLNIRTLTLAAAGAIIWSVPSHAASDATGLWKDQNGRAAIEIAPCGSGNGLCGYVVYLFQQQYADRCGMQILGNVTSNGGGWVYSPDRGKKYPVELTRLSDDKLRVIGNAGSFFTKTYTWTRVEEPATRCDGTSAKAPEPEKKVDTASAAPEAAPAPASEPDREPSSTRSLGAPSGSMALIGQPKKKRVAEVKPDTITDASPAPAEPVTKEPAAKAPAAPEKTAAAPVERKEESFEPRKEESFVPERKCKFKIPYVGRVIDVPCRN